MKAGKKEVNRRIYSKSKYASPVCYSNSPEVRPEYINEDVTDKDDINIEPKEKMPSEQSDK